MNESQSSSRSDPAESRDVTGTQARESGLPPTIGVYERPEQKSGVSLLTIGIIAILIIAVILAVLFLQSVF